MAELLYDSELFQVLGQIRDNDIVLVTFNEMDFKHNDKNFWAEAVATKLGLSAIGFVSKFKNWFPSDEMRFAADVISPLISQFRTVILYGHSQGGYAAAKYSRMLGATHVLAFSPQWSIDPAEVAQFDRRFIEHYRAELNGSMAIGKDDVAGVGRIFSDPHWKEDYTHARLIADAYGQPVIVDCNYLFHSTVRAIASNEYFAELISLCVDGADVLKFRDMIRRSKRDCFAYYHGLGMTALRRNHRIAALGLFKTACEMSDPASPLMVQWKSYLDQKWPAEIQRAN